MGRNKDLRKKIVGYHEIIAKHERKIQFELSREQPDESLIAHWQREINGWREIESRLTRRLKRDW
jgi:hypothetical protein